MEIIHIFPPNNNKYKNLLDMNDEKKIIIYQVFTRLFGNNNNHCVYNGDISTNGCGKMADFTLKADRKSVV